MKPPTPSGGLATYLKAISIQNKLVIDMTSPSTETMSGVDVTSDDNYIIVCGVPTFGFAPLYIYNNGTWTQYDLTLSSLWDVSLINNYGFVVGSSGTIVEWSGKETIALDAQSGTITTKNLYGVHLSDIIPGVLALNVAIAVGADGTIIRWLSTTGTWSVVTSGTTEHLRSVIKDSSNNYWICGDSGIILYSADYGVTWSSVTSGTTKNLNAISVSTNVGIIVGETSTILKTSNLNGTSTIWSVITSPIQVGDFHGACMNSDQEAIICGDAGSLLHYDGTNINVLPSGNNVILTKVKGKYPRRLLVSGDGAILQIHSSCIPSIIMNDGKEVTPLSEQYKEKQIFTNEGITDTNAHNSILFNSSRYKYVTFYITNTHNQALTVQVKGNRSNSTTGAVNIGSTFTIAATTGIEARTLVMGNDGYLPYLFITVTASVAPTTGNINSYSIGRN